LGDGAEASLPTNLRLGLCGGAGRWFEIRNGPSTMPNGDRSSMYGALKNSSVSTFVHNFSTSGGTHINTSHFNDLAGGSVAWNDNEHDVTVECGLYQVDATQPNNVNSMIKIDRGYHWIIRDNTFETINGSGGPSALNFSSHAANGTEGISGGGTAGAGAQVYRNLFHNVSSISNEIAADLDVYNNVFLYDNPDTGTFGIIRYAFQAAAADDVPISNVRVFNNTVYYNSDNQSAGLLAWDNPGTPTRPVPTNLQLFNNLVYHTGHHSPNGASIFSSNCNHFGANGVNIRNNFIYTPNDSSPSIWSGCSGPTGNSAAPYNVNPGLTNPTGGNFSLTASSPLIGKGVGSGAPASDFSNQQRPNPPAIGAYDLAGTGVTPLPPPTLVQITTN